jgi:hypothetical protein
VDGIALSCVRNPLSERRERWDCGFEFIHVRYAVVISNNVCQWTKLFKAENTLTISH